MKIKRVEEKVRTSAEFLNDDLLFPYPQIPVKSSHLAQLYCAYRSMSPSFYLKYFCRS